MLVGVKLRISLTFYFAYLKRHERKILMLGKERVEHEDFYQKYFDLALFMITMEIYFDKAKKENA